MSWSRVDRLKHLVAAAAVVYAVTGLLLLIFLPAATATRTFPDWMAVPLQVLAVVVSAVLVTGRRRTAGNSWHLWAFVCGFCVMSLVATYAWNWFRVMGNDRMLSIADLGYFIDYALITGAYAVAFRDSGGTFRSIRTWLDGLTIFVALLATFWATLLGPFTPPGQSQPKGLVFGGSYVISIAVLISMAALLFLRLSRVRSTVLMLLIAAGLIDMIWEIAWLANWVRHLHFLGLFYNIGDVLCFTLIICAAAMTPQVAPVPATVPGTVPGTDRDLANADRSPYTFVPTLSALLATALIAIFLAIRATDAWVLVGLVVLTALLLAARQAAVREELSALNHSLAVLAADSRLTELVRQSGDVFLVVDAQGAVTFASPAAEGVLLATPLRLQGTPATQLLGAVHGAALKEFLGRLVQEAVSPEPLELTVASATGAARVLRISGANQLANPHIEGVALTITDVSTLRELERDVLEVSNQERVRLAGDIHEGLGQQLTGITLMLQGATKTPDPDPAKQRDYLNMIVGQLAEAIRGVRDLARGLSPVYVVGGSLGGALHRLGKDSSAHTPVHVAVDARFDDRIISDFPADHLFRIAQEAVQNATRHSGCTQARVELQVVQDYLVLAVSDNGSGCEYLPHTSNGLGLRMMEYRARVIGGSFSIGRQPNTGTRVQVTVPLGYVLGEGMEPQALQPAR